MTEMQQFLCVLVLGELNVVKVVLLSVNPVDVCYSVFAIYKTGDVIFY